MIRLLLLLLLVLFQRIQAKVINFDDAEIQYFGRWQKTAKDIQSVSSGAYLKTLAYGGDEIKFKLSQSAIIYIQMDNKRHELIRKEAVYKDSYYQVTIQGAVSDILTVVSDINSTICLQSIEITTTTTTSQTSITTTTTTTTKDLLPPFSQALIEFVGHDLTLGLGTSQSLMTSFPWLISDLLGTERSQIAAPGAWLIDHEGEMGMETQYFRGESFYTPHIVTVLLGEYDKYIASYATHLTRFLTQIRRRFPQAQVLVLSEPLGVLYRESQTAVHNVNDPQVHFVDTTGWTRFGPTAYLNRLHLNDYGQAIFARKLAPLLQAKLKGLPFPIQPNPNLPYDWQTTDVGQEQDIGLTGSVSFDSAHIFTLWGSGQASLQGFRFVYQTLSGGGAIEATVESHAAFASCAKAGIMMRQHLGHASPQLMLGFSPQQGVFLMHQNVTRHHKKLSPPYRLRLQRMDTTVMASIAAHSGGAWEFFANVTVDDMAQDIYLGLAVSSCDPNVVSVAKFADVRLEGGVGGDGSYYANRFLRQQ